MTVPARPKYTGKDKAQRPMSSKGTVKVILSAATATSALSNPAITTTAPTTGAIDTQDFPLARLFFGGTDAPNETVNYQVILWYPVDMTNGVKAWQPQLAAKGTYTLGATALPTDVESASGYYADTVTDTIGQTGTIIRSPADDSVASLDVDIRNAAILQVQTDLGTGAKADVLCLLGESIGSLSDFDVSVAGTGLATSALQTTGNSSLTSIDGKIPDQGQALEAASTPVVLPATQMASLSGPYTTVLNTWRATITAVSQALATIKGSALSSNLREIYIHPENFTDNIRFAVGTATATTTRLPPHGMILPINKTLADTLQFIDGSGGTVYVGITELG